MRCTKCKYIIGLAHYLKLLSNPKKSRRIQMKSFPMTLCRVYKCTDCSNTTPFQAFKDQCKEREQLVRETAMDSPQVFMRHIPGVELISDQLLRIDGMLYLSKSFNHKSTNIIYLTYIDSDNKLLQNRFVFFSFK